MKNYTPKLAALVVLIATSCGTPPSDQAVTSTSVVPDTAKIDITVSLSSLNELYPNYDFTCQVIDVSSEHFTLSSASPSAIIEPGDIIQVPDTTTQVLFTLKTNPPTDSAQSLLTRYKIESEAGVCPNSSSTTINNSLIIDIDKGNCTQTFHIKGYLIAKNKIYHILIDPKLKVGQGDPPN